MSFHLIHWNWKCLPDSGPLTPKLGSREATEMNAVEVFLNGPFVFMLSSYTSTPPIMYCTIGKDGQNGLQIYIRQCFCFLLYCFFGGVWKVNYFFFNYYFFIFFYFFYFFFIIWMFLLEKISLLFLLYFIMWCYSATFAPDLPALSRPLTHLAVWKLPFFAGQFSSPVHDSAGLNQVIQWKDVCAC